MVLMGIEHERLSIRITGLLQDMDDDELAIDIVLEGELLERKMRALYEHVSQLDALVQAFGSDTLAEGFASESFSRAPVEPGGSR